MKQRKDKKWLCILINLQRRKHCSKQTNIMIPIRKPAPIISNINNKSNSQFLWYPPKKAPLKMIYFTMHGAMILYNLIKFCKQILEVTVLRTLISTLSRLSLRISITNSAIRRQRTGSHVDGYGRLSEDAYHNATVHPCH